MYMFYHSCTTLVMYDINLVDIAQSCIDMYIVHSSMCYPFTHFKAGMCVAISTQAASAIVIELITWNIILASLIFVVNSTGHAFLLIVLLRDDIKTLMFNAIQNLCNLTLNSTYTKLIFLGNILMYKAKWNGSYFPFAIKTLFY